MGRSPTEDHLDTQGFPAGLREIDDVIRGDLSPSFPTPYPSPSTSPSRPDVPSLLDPEEG